MGKMLSAVTLIFPVAIFIKFLVRGLQVKGYASRFLAERLSAT